MPQFFDLNLATDLKLDFVHPDSGTPIATFFTYQALFKIKPELKQVINAEQDLKIKTKEAA